MENSPHGPRRREYLLNRSISLSIDFAPNLFRARLFSFDSPEIEAGGDSNDLFRSLNDVAKRPEESGKMRPLGSLISEIDKRLANIQDERSVLLYVRHLAMKEVAKAISGMPMTWDEKKALYQLINERENSVGRNLEDSQAQGRVGTRGHREPATEPLVRILKKRRRGFFPGGRLRLIKPGRSFER